MFGADLGGVKAHTGPAAQAACEDLAARAFSFGEDIAFADPSPDRALVAHELTHALQGAGGGGMSRPGAVSERQAAAAEAAVAGGRAPGGRGAG